MQRYSYKSTQEFLEQDPDGDWVGYEDACEEITRVTAALQADLSRVTAERDAMVLCADGLIHDVPSILFDNEFYKGQKHSAQLILAAGEAAKGGE